MFQKLFRFMGFSETTASFTEYIIKVVTWLSIIGAGGLMGLSAYTSAAYAAFGWSAVVGSAIVAVALMGFALWTAGAAYKAWREGIYLRSLDARPTGFNPKADGYSDQIFRLQDMFHPMSHALEHKNFHNCDIIGPGVVMFDQHVAFHGRMEFLDCGDVIFPPAGTVLTSVLVFRGCTFRNCRFFRVGLLTSSHAILNAFVASGARDPRIPPAGAAGPAEPAPNQA